MQTVLDAAVYKSAKLALKRLGKIGTVGKKLQAVIAAHKHGIGKTSEVMGVSRTSIYLWAKEIKGGKVESLINQAKHKEGFKLNNECKETIKAWLNKNPNLTILEIKELLQKECGISVSKSTVHRAIKSSGYSYITGRKQHYKQDKDLVENFKK